MERRLDPRPQPVFDFFSQIGFPEYKAMPGGRNRRIFGSENFALLNKQFLYFVSVFHVFIEFVHSMECLKKYTGAA
jgi:hypothetical protein